MATATAAKAPAVDSTPAADLAAITAHGATGHERGDASRPPASADELAFVERLRARDEHAFVTLIERYGPGLGRLARLYCTDAVADEVVQETWLGVIMGIDRFEGRSSLRSWIVGILKNVARSRGAREHRQIPFSAFVDPATDQSPSVDPERFRSAEDAWAGHWRSYPERWDESPERHYLSTEGVEVARRAIADLPPAQREVVSLRDVDGWSSAEVAEALGISPGNQRVLLHRGRAKVRAVLEAALAARDRTEAGR